MCHGWSLCSFQIISFPRSNRLYKLWWQFWEVTLFCYIKDWTRLQTPRPGPAVHGVVGGGSGLYPWSAWESQPEFATCEKNDSNDMTHVGEERCLCVLGNLRCSICCCLSTSCLPPVGAATPAAQQPGNHGNWLHLRRNHWPSLLPSSSIVSFHVNNEGEGSLIFKVNQETFDPLGF